MSYHNHDPITHTHGLQNGCARCQELSDDVTGLDEQNTARIWRGDCHTSLDRRAQDAMYRAAVIAQRLVQAFQWENFDPGIDSILSYAKTEARNVAQLFEVYDGRDKRALAKAPDHAD